MGPEACGFGDGQGEGEGGGFINGGRPREGEDDGGGDAVK